MAKPVQLFKLPSDASDQFQDAYLNPHGVTFAAKYRGPDGKLVPILYLASGLKLAVSDEMFADVINSCDIIKPEVPDAFHKAWPDLDKEE